MSNDASENTTATISADRHIVQREDTNTTTRIHDKTCAVSSYVSMSLYLRPRATLYDDRRSIHLPSSAEPRRFSFPRHHFKREEGKVRRCEERCARARSDHMFSCVAVAATQRRFKYMCPPGKERGSHLCRMLCQRRYFEKSNESSASSSYAGPVYVCALRHVRPRAPRLTHESDASQFPIARPGGRHVLLI